jgi:alpha-tubulin suppressor-like RCC1 family protein
VRTWWLVLALGCGRIGFDANASQGPDDSGIVPFDVSFEVPVACLDATAPQTCSTTTTGVTAIAAGSFHTCVIRNSGLACWGENMSGALGFCDAAPQVLVPTTTFAFPVAQLALGELHMCVRLIDGQVWCWGSRFQGETGDGISTQSSPIPRRVPGVFRDLASRRYHTCAIDSGGALYCWGGNTKGELGIGDTMDRGSPQRVGTKSNWVQVVVGGLFTCARDTTGAAFCWGDNTDGAIGDGTRQPRSTPTPVAGSHVFTSLSAGKTHVCGHDGGGVVWCWGHGGTGQLGNAKQGPNADELVPFQVGAYASVAAAWFLTCALDGAGALWCWGDNTMRTLAPIDQDTLATPQQLGSGPFVEVAAGGYQICTRTASSVVACHGLNDRGQLGLGDLMDRDTPQPLCF